MKNFAMLLLVAVVCLGVTAVADDEGHHHEEMTAQQLGTVHFPVSCNAAAQKDFEHGVALLHSFWYDEAEKQFKALENGGPRSGMPTGVWTCVSFVSENASAPTAARRHC